VIQPFAIGDQVRGRNLIAVRSSSPGAPVLLLATPTRHRLSADEPTLGANAVLAGVARACSSWHGRWILGLRLQSIRSVWPFLTPSPMGACCRLRCRDWPASFLSTASRSSVPRCASPRSRVVGLAQVGAAASQFFRTRPPTQALDRCALAGAQPELKLEAIFPAQSRSLPSSPTAPFVTAGLPTAGSGGSRRACLLADGAETLRCRDAECRRAGLGELAGERPIGLLCSCQLPRWSVRAAVVESRFLKRPVRIRIPWFMVVRSGGRF
jgi:hypothetical protein